MAALAGLEHVLVKLSGLTTMADLEHWSTADLAPWVDHLLACFGADRVLFGSDWPVSRRAGDYARTIATARELVAALSPDERAAVLAGTARAAYRLPERSDPVKRVDNQAGLTAALVLVVVCVGVVSSLGAPLIPAIAESRGVSPAAAQWSLTVTLLTGAVMAPVLGRLGDGPRRREVVLVTLGLVAAGCVLAAPDWGFATLLVGRSHAGARPGADAARASRSCATTSTRSEYAARSCWSRSPRSPAPASATRSAARSPRSAAWARASGSAPAWSWSRCSSPPACSRPAATSTGPASTCWARCCSASAWPGCCSCSARAGSGAGPRRRCSGIAVASPVLLVLWVLHENRSSSPLVDLRLLRHGPVLVADLTALSAGVGVYLLMSSVSWLLQSPATGSAGGFGLSTLVAAGAMVPFSITSVATAQLVVPRLLERLGDAWSMPIGCLVFGVAMVLLAVLREHPWQAYLVMAIGGVGAGCTFSSMPSVIVRAVPPGEVGSATGLNQVMRSIGYATGAASFAAVLAAYADPRTGSTPPIGFDVAAWIGVVVFVGTALLDLVLLRGSRTPTRYEPELVTPP